MAPRQSTASQALRTLPHQRRCAVEIWLATPDRLEMMAQQSLSQHPIGGDESHCHDRPTHRAKSSTLLLRSKRQSPRISVTSRCSCSSTKFFLPVLFSLSTSLASVTAAPNFALPLLRSTTGLADGPGSPPTDAEDPVLSCQPCLCHHRTCVIGSHLQQDHDISEAPSHRGAPFPLFDTVHVRKPRPKKLETISSKRQLTCVSVTTHVLPLSPSSPRRAGRHLHRRVIAAS